MSAAYLGPHAEAVRRMEKEIEADPWKFNGMHGFKANEVNPYNPYTDVFDCAGLKGFLSASLFGLPVYVNPYMQRGTACITSGEWHLRPERYTMSTLAAWYSRWRENNRHPYHCFPYVGNPPANELPKSRAAVIADFYSGAIKRNPYTAYTHLPFESPAEHIALHKALTRPHASAHIKEKPVGFTYVHKEILEDYRPDFKPGDLLYSTEEDYYLKVTDVIRRSSAKGATLTVKVGYQNYPLNNDKAWAAFRKEFLLVGKEYVQYGSDHVATRTWVEKKITAVTHDLWEYEQHKKERGLSRYDMERIAKFVKVPVVTPVKVPVKNEVLFAVGFVAGAIGAAVSLLAGALT